MPGISDSCTIKPDPLTRSKLLISYVYEFSHSLRITIKSSGDIIATDYNLVKLGGMGL